MKKWKPKISPNLIGGLYSQLVTNKNFSLGIHIRGKNNTRLAFIDFLARNPTKTIKDPQNSLTVSGICLSK